MDGKKTTRQATRRQSLGYAKLMLQFYPIFVPISAGKAFRR